LGIFWQKIIDYKTAESAESAEERGKQK